MIDLLQWVQNAAACSVLRTWSEGTCDTELDAAVLATGAVADLTQALLFRRLGFYLEKP